MITVPTIRQQTTNSKRHACVCVCVCVCCSQGSQSTHNKTKQRAWEAGTLPFTGYSPVTWTLVIQLNSQ